MSGTIETIEVGEIRSNGLRLWSAREALRQAETNIRSQMEAQALMVSRAVAALGWNVTISLAIAGAASALHRDVAFALPIFFLLIGALCSLRVIWPKYWDVVGDQPSWITTIPYDTELEMVEALVIRANEAAGRNSDRMLWLARFFRASGICLVLASAAALIIALGAGT